MTQATDKQDKENEQMQRETALEKRVEELEVLLEKQDALTAAAYTKGMDDAGR